MQITREAMRDGQSLGSKNSEEKAHSITNNLITLDSYVAASNYLVKKEEAYFKAASLILMSSR